MQHITYLTISDILEYRFALSEVLTDFQSFWYNITKCFTLNGLKKKSLIYTTWILPTLALLNICQCPCSISLPFFPFLSILCSVSVLFLFLCSRIIPERSKDHMHLCRLNYDWPSVRQFPWLCTIPGPFQFFNNSGFNCILKICCSLFSSGHFSSTFTVIHPFFFHCSRDSILEWLSSCMTSRRLSLLFILEIIFFLFVLIGQTLLDLV